MITTDGILLKEIIFKYNVLLKIYQKEPNVSVDTAMWAAQKLWEKELKDEEKLID